MLSVTDTGTLTPPFSTTTTVSVYRLPGLRFITVVEAVWISASVLSGVVESVISEVVSVYEPESGAACPMSTVIVVVVTDVTLIPSNDCGSAEIQTYIYYYGIVFKLPSYE